MSQTASISYHFLYQNLFVPKDISKILTADNTLAFAQVTITPENYAKIKTLEEKTALDSQKIIKKFETLSGSNFEKDIKSWIGPRIGVAYLKNTKTGKSFSVYFLASRNHQKALNFLSQKKLTENEKIISEKFGHYKIYSYQISQNLAYTTLQRYIVISNDTENLKNYLQTISENRLKVKNDKNFITINNNLPSRSIGFFYVNIPKLSADLNFAKYFGIIGPLLNPVLDIFPASGVAALPKDQGIVFSTYTIINKNNFFTLPEDTLSEDMILKSTNKPGYAKVTITYRGKTYCVSNYSSNKNDNYSFDKIYEKIYSLYEKIFPGYDIVEEGIVKFIEPN